ncbi:MAG: molybdopterin-dependent oxidoreductase, partial [Proteobacteria bacterium]|nr:molybdopterin-dependent oxidoreductase [Pseudomonadota bacterium]
KAWVVAGTNLITSLPGRQETIEALKKLDHLVVVDILPTEITRYADVLLPAASYLERPDPLVATQNRDSYVAIRRAATEPLGESQCECLIAAGMGKAMGLSSFWAWTSLEEFDERIVATYNKGHGDHPIDWDELNSRGCVILDDQSPIYREGLGLGPKGEQRAGREATFPEFDRSEGNNRVRLYSMDLDRVWRQKTKAGDDPTGFEPLPTYYAPSLGPPGHVRLLYGRSPVHTFGRTQNTPVLHGREKENAIWVSPTIAAAFNVADCDAVEVVNQDGVRQGPVKLKVTSRMGNEAVYLTHGHGHNSRQLSRAYRKGADDSALITRYVVDPISGGTAMRVNFVRLVKPHRV